MKRRNFLKVMGAGAAAYAVTPLGRRVIDVLAAPQTATSTADQLVGQSAGNVKAPSGGLGSNSNYFLYSDCKPVTDLSITVEITKDIKAAIGFSIQLNAYSPQDANCIYQQYGMSFDTSNGSPLKVSAWVDNWPSDGFRQTLNQTSGDLINDFGHNWFTLPSVTLPAGSKFTISLEYDKDQNVNGAKYLFVDNNGKSTTKEIKLEQLDVNHSSPAIRISSIDLAPINAFELNIVGPGNGKYTYLTSGAGTITYTASSPLTVLNSKPACCAAQDVYTKETANNVYGALPAGPSKNITQSFDVVEPTLYTPGAALAVSTMLGAAQADLFAITSTGQLGVMYFVGIGRWHSLTPPKGSESFVLPGTALAVSQQFGAENQTDVFLVDQDGILNVFWINGTGAWNGPQTIGPKRLTRPGGNLAVSQHFGVPSQTDVFVVDNDGQLNMFSAISLGLLSDIVTAGQDVNWRGPRLIGDKGLAKSGANLAVSQRRGTPSFQTDVFVVDTKGQLNVFSADATGHWSGPEAVGPTGLAPSAAPLAVSLQYGTENQTDVFLVDNKGQLTVFAVDGPTGHWIGPRTIGPMGLARAGAALAVTKDFGTSNQTDVFLIDTKGQLNMFWVDGIGHWNGPKTIGPAGIAPAGGVVVATSKYGANNTTDVFLISATETKTPGWPMVFESSASGDWIGPKALTTEI